MIEFTIQPDKNRKEYFIIKIFDNLHQLKKYGNEQEKGLGNGCDAFFYGKFPKRGDYCIGEIVFTLTRFTHPTIAHETTHAMFHWLRFLHGKLNNKTVDKIEEKLVIANENLVEQIILKFQRRKRE